MRNGASRLCEIITRMRRIFNVKAAKGDLCSILQKGTSQVTALLHQYGAEAEYGNTVLPVALNIRPYIGKRAYRCDDRAISQSWEGAHGDSTHRTPAMRWVRIVLREVWRRIVASHATYQRDFPELRTVTDDRMTLRSNRRHRMRISTSWGRLLVPVEHVVNVNAQNKGR